MNKKPESKFNELKFIFQEFLRGLSDKEIVEEIKKMELSSPTLLFIREKRKDFNAAESVLRSYLEQKIDPMITQKRMAHYEQLAKTAEILLEDDLRKLITAKDESSGENYNLLIAGYPESITHKQIIGRLEANVASACEKYGTWWVFDCFIAHVEAEYPEGQDFYISMEADTIKLITMLMTLAHRKTFKGTCPVCEEWQR